MTIESIMNRFGALLRYFAALAVASTLCAAVSYGIVRYLTRDVDVYTRSDVNALREATELRESMNILAELTGEFMARTDSTEPTAAYATWRQRDFQPRLDALRDRLVHVPDAYESLVPLLRAADALHMTAAGQSDVVRRERTARTVLEAILAGERRVGELGVNPNKLPPLVPAPGADRS